MDKYLQYDNSGDFYSSPMKLNIKKLIKKDSFKVDDI
jgi:hypothetical protein